MRNSSYRHIAVSQAAGRAFTLIELLVVLAIIALLTAILVPSLSMAKLLARRANCQANLHVIGCGAAMYGADNKEFVPMSWENTDPAQHPMAWKSWRTCLLDYVPSFAVFNCPSAVSIEMNRQVFHSVEEVLEVGGVTEGTRGAGSYGVMEQSSRDSFNTLNNDTQMRVGNPMWSPAFPTAPGLAWAEPSNSLYIADAVRSMGPPRYPSPSPYRGLGTSTILPPSQDKYFKPELTRRFADRHLGTNCLMLSGQVVNYPTQVLDEMKEGTQGCIWDVD